MRDDLARNMSYWIIHAGCGAKKLVSVSPWHITRRNKGQSMSSSAQIEQETNRRLYEYWDRIRKGRFAPWRSDVEPADIHQMLPDIFLAEVAENGKYRFRLAGTRICSVYRRELKGQDLFDRWSHADREGFETLFHSASHDGTVSAVRFRGYTEAGKSAPFEMIILPLRHHDGKISRFLGAITPAERPYWLGTDPIEKHALEDLDVIWPDDPPHFMKRVVNELGSPAPAYFEHQGGQRRGHLTVLDGGRQD